MISKKQLNDWFIPIMLMAILSILSIKLYLNSLSKKLLQIPVVPGWPIIGNVLNIDPLRPYITLTSWANRYGDAFFIKIFSQSILVLNGRDVIIEAAIEKVCHTC